MATFTKKKISKNLSLGDKLVRARKKLGVDLRAAEKETKVAFKHLAALEKNSYDALPEPVYVRGFLTRYATYLDLKSEAILAEFEQDWENFKQAHTLISQKQNDDLLKPRVSDELLKKQGFWVISPELIWGSSIGFGVLGIFMYVWFQVTSFAAAPPLEIINPLQSNLVSVETVEIKGVTDASATLKINDQAVKVDDSGRFVQQLRLVDGLNTVKISATNQADKETTKVIQIMAELQSFNPDEQNQSQTATPLENQ